MKTMEQFYNEVMLNDELYESFLASVREEKADEFLKEHEVEGTLEEFERFFAKKLTECGELTDEQLEAISGGGLFNIIFKARHNSFSPWESTLRKL